MSGCTPEASREQGGIKVQNFEEGKGDGYFPVALESRAGRDLSGRSRGVVQRHLRQERIRERVEQSVTALNTLAGYATPRVQGGSCTEFGRGLVARATAVF